MTVFIVLILAVLGAAWLGGTQLLTSPVVTGGCTQPAAPSAAIGAFAAAIAFAEGSNPAWNNPGDLTKSFGYPTAGTVNSAGVLKFTNCADGWNALYEQLTDIVNGVSVHSLTDSLAVFGLSYSGGDPNWSANVASKLGVTQSTTLGDILT